MVESSRLPNSRQLFRFNSFQHQLHAGCASRKLVMAAMIVLLVAGAMILNRLSLAGHEINFGLFSPIRVKRVHPGSIVPTSGRSKFVSLSLSACAASVLSCGCALLAILSRYALVHESFKISWTRLSCPL